MKTPFRMKEGRNRNENKFMVRTRQIFRTQQSSQLKGESQQTYRKIMTFCFILIMLSVIETPLWAYTGQLGESDAYAIQEFQSSDRRSGVFVGYNRSFRSSGLIAPSSGPLEFWTTTQGRWYLRMRLTEDGQLLTTSSIERLSDSRLKTEITPLNQVLEKLAQVRGLSYKWNEEGTSLGLSAGRREVGVLAQEVEAVFPELVSSWGETDYKAIDYAKLAGVLIAAVNELRAEKDDQIANLETRLAALEQTDGARSVSRQVSSSVLSIGWLVASGLVLAGMVCGRCHTPRGRVDGDVVGFRALSAVGWDKNRESQPLTFKFGEHSLFLNMLLLSFCKHCSPIALKDPFKRRL